MMILNQILINSIKYSKGKDDKIQIESKEISEDDILEQELDKKIEEALQKIYS